ncbi:MAG TPA: hypothetical protein VLJ44_07760 [Gaiellaceae bacterium]|nr:hypothetical protein [Gaiellaceae bacterium]
MALAKLDDGGGPVPPPTKGNSSPPPNGGSSPENQPSNSNSGKKPEGGKNKNKTQPEAKKPAASQPVTAPKGETLADAIKRMFAEGWNGHQVHDQIKKWHPNWTEYQIDQAMMKAPKPKGPLPASPQDAKGKNYGHGGGIKELKRDLGAVEHIVKTAGHVAADTAESVARHDARDVRIATRYGKVVVRELKAHPADVAAAASILALVSPPGLDLAFIAIAAEASREAGDKARRHGKYAEAALDYASAITGPLGAAGKIGKVFADARVARGSARLAQLGREAQVSPLSSAPPLTEAERDTLARLVEEQAAARSGAKGFREAQLKAAVAAAVTAVAADPRFNPRLRENKHR